MCHAPMKQQTCAVFCMTVHRSWQQTCASSCMCKMLKEAASVRHTSSLDTPTHFHATCYNTRISWLTFTCDLSTCACRVPHVPHISFCVIHVFVLHVPHVFLRDTRTRLITGLDRAARRIHCCSSGSSSRRETADVTSQLRTHLLQQWFKLEEGDS